MTIKMNDYCNGIAYASGYFAKENGKQYLFVRNLDPWYAKVIEYESGYKTYESKYNVKRDGRNQWSIKARNINRIPELSEIQNINDFCRAYIEIHGIFDLAIAKKRNGDHFKKPRLRIYGTEKVISFINDSLPATKKKIQYINNIVDSAYVGKTCVIYYQSKKEILNILEWIDGNPKNECVWNKWKDIMDTKGFFML